MSQSRVSQLLLHSRSRHDVVDNPELRRISRQWQFQKRRSRESENQFKKMLRQLSYFEQLNQKLLNEVEKGRRKVRFTESIRERYNQDKRKKYMLENLRLQERRKNLELANKIKVERNERLKAVQLNAYKKKSLGQFRRSQSRELMRERQERRFDSYLKNRSRVEQVVEFECNLRESAVRQKQNENEMHIRHHQQAIMKEKETMKIRQLREADVKRKLKALTESSTSKLHTLQDINRYMLKFKSPYYSPLHFNRKKLKPRCITQKSDMDRIEQQSTLFISHPSGCE